MKNYNDTENQFAAIGETNHLCSLNRRNQLRIDYSSTGDLRLGMAIIPFPSKFQQPLNVGRQLPVEQHQQYGYQPYCRSCPNEMVNGAAYMPLQMKYSLSDQQIRCWQTEYLHRQQKFGNDNTVKISEMCEALTTFMLHINNLKCMLNSYETNKHKMDTESWNDLYRRMQYEKNRLTVCKRGSCFNEMNLETLKARINRRKKKRRWMRNWKNKKILQRKSESIYEVAEKYAQILMKRTAQVKESEELKKHADVLLSTNLRSIAEANRHIKMLSCLLKLYQNRIEKSQNVNLSSSNNLKIIVSNLKNKWEDKLKEYKTKEIGLRLMLEEESEENMHQKIIKLEGTFRKWTYLLFGNAVNDDKSIYYSDETQFISIRKGWDKYICEDDDASLKIPPGWILPPAAHDSTWKNLEFI